MQMGCSYTWEAARQRLMEANGGSLDADAADVLMRRGTTRTADGLFSFARDLRHVIPSLSGYTEEQHVQVRAFFSVRFLSTVDRNIFLAAVAVAVRETSAVSAPDHQGRQGTDVRGPAGARALRPALPRLERALPLRRRRRHAPRPPGPCRRRGAARRPVLRRALKNQQRHRRRYWPTYT